MAASNHERVGKALEFLNRGLLPFLQREMQAVYKDRWQESAQAALPAERGAGRRGPFAWDTQKLLTVLWERWNDVFKNVLGPAERSLVSELREVRNRWAHQNAFTTDDAYRALDSIQRLLTAVSAEEAQEVDRQKQELLRIRFEEQARRETKKTAVTPVEGQPKSGLTPWREIVTPHPDVASGRYQQAEFAADLWQVYLREGSDEYKHPSEFYRRTFLTDGLTKLLTRAMQRLVGKGGDPVVELQTNFGGGKTHSLLALYHLFSGTPAAELPGIDRVLNEAAVPLAENVKRAVLVGTRISPGQPHKQPDGTVVRTLWGELAWQLGGKQAYQEFVKKADETATNPGDALRALFNKYAPCLILIDEWVAFARQLHDEGLPAGTFDTQFTFAQALTECAKAADRTLLVVSIPASEDLKRPGQTQVSEYEIGGERGKLALQRLKNAIGRVEASWRPASAEESFEIVRRRLFQPITDPHLFTARDAVVRGFAELYRGQSQEFPAGCREGDYERRLQAAYPIHAELFDRLYNDWSTLDKFQRTRGVLRLMAAVIHALWEGQDNNLLILPASIPIHEPAVQFELTRYVEDPWVPVIERDIDGPHSLPLQLDRENPNLGRYSACRRVARTLYIGSAATFHTAHKGLEDRQVKLGCAQPGESVATFGDALRRLTDQATHLYVDGRRYWYSTQPSVTRLAQDRAAQQDADAVAEEIKRRLRAEQSNRGDFVRVHACPASGGDVPDEPEARLVILSPETAHAARSEDSPARKVVAEMLDQRGNSPRHCRNMLVFLAADRTRLSELEQAVRQFLAWKSIVAERESLNLDPFQFNQAKTKFDQADEAVQQRIPETYSWLLVPGQPKPDAAVEWQEIRLQGQDALAVRASKKLRNAEQLIVQFAGTRLRMELDRIPLWRGDHVSLKQLAEDFAQYLYLPRLKDNETLLDSVQEGLSLLTWKTETFAYAEGWDELKSRYQALQAGKRMSVSADGPGLLVRPEVAAKQLEAEAAKPGPTVPPGPRPHDGKLFEGEGAEEDETPPLPPEKRLARFHGSVALDATRLGRDAGKIAEEVVQHLTGLVDADVNVTLEIHAELPEGAPDHVVRTVTENCRTLRFKQHGFEEA